ncbi:hypothetical protein OIU84_016385 [Salix udensis]|uniref:Uncharacterized protein n=1 Tax=Salix udensis TaxID=889485 RepID=A0AAD6J9V4_9ROSI|nr:hypothetical protein OIU84_016385 [Salix udensis]
MAIRVAHLLENQAMMGRKLAVGKKPEMAVGRILSQLKKLAMGKKPEMAMGRKLAVGKKPEMAMGRILSLLKKLAMAMGRILSLLKKPEMAMGRILSLLKKLAMGKKPEMGMREDSFSAEETGDCNGDSIGAEDAKDKAGPRQSGLALFPALQGTQMTSEKNERREGIRRRRMDLSSSIIFSGRRGEMEREYDGGS